MISERKLKKLSEDEFITEIFTVASSIGAIELDRREDCDAIEFLCSDKVGNLKLTIRRT